MAKSRSSPEPAAAWASASPMNCCAPAPPSSAARARPWTPSRVSTPTRLGARASQKVCDQGDYRSIDSFVADVVAIHGRIDILVNNAGGTVPAPHAESIPELVQRIQGAPRSDDDYERTALFHAYAVQMNLISPLWFAIRAYRQMRTQDGVGLHHQHLQRRRTSGGITDAGLLRCGQERAQPPDPVAGRGVGARRYGSTASRWVRR